MTDHTRCQFSDDGTSWYDVLGSERNRPCPEGAVRQFALVSGPTVLSIRRELVDAIRALADAADQGDPRCAREDCGHRLSEHDMYDCSAPYSGAGPSIPGAICCCESFDYSGQVDRAGTPPTRRS